MKSVGEKIRKIADGCIDNRMPLVLKAVKPKQIQHFAPAFIDGFQPGKDNDPNRERAELKKLKKQLRREKKHAMRALQRDSEFIARERQRSLQKVLDEKARKMKRVRGEMEREYADTNIHALKRKKRQEEQAE